MMGSFFKKAPRSSLKKEKLSLHNDPLNDTLMTIYSLEKMHPVSDIFQVTKKYERIVQ